jgi:small GTP-binding protein
VSTNGIRSIRNIALLGPSGAGKTTIVEALLHAAGVVASPGTVEAGTTASDHDALSQKYGHSLYSTPVSFNHDGLNVNVIDTPGLVDFTGMALSVTPAVETVAVVVNAQTGLEPQARRFLDWAAERKFCRMIIVNRIDAEGVDLPALVDDLRDTFGSEVLPINLPANGGKDVVDCFFQPDGASDFSSVADAHTRIIEQIVEMDEALMAQYLEQGESLEPEQLHDPFESCMRAGHIVPVCFTNAKGGVGVKALLEVFERLMPNPLEGNPRPFLLGEGDAAHPLLGRPRRRETRRRARLPRHLRSLPGQARRRCACTRVCCARTPSSSSATRASPSRSPTCTSSAARSRSRSKRPIPATSWPSPRSTSCTRTSCCTTPTTRTTSTSSASPARAAVRPGAVGHQPQRRPEAGRVDDAVDRGGSLPDVRARRRAQRGRAARAR